MTAHVAEEVHGKVLEVHLTGKLVRSDYQKFVPQSEAMIKEHGKIRVLPLNTASQRRRKMANASRQKDTRTSDGDQNTTARSTRMARRHPGAAGSRSRADRNVAIMMTQNGRVYHVARIEPTEIPIQRDGALDSH